jgi:16S rRNA (uracil1498-N3)-methyltransferase
MAVEKPTLACFIGPEGGFTDDEVGLARSSGILTITLGERILRMETAAVVALALFIHELG